MSYKSEMLKLYTIEDLFKYLKHDTVEAVVGILKNITMVNQNMMDN